MDDSKLRLRRPSQATLALAAATATTTALSSTSTAATTPIGAGGGTTSIARMVCVEEGGGGGSNGITTTTEKHHGASDGGGGSGLLQKIKSANRLLELPNLTRTLGKGTSTSPSGAVGGGGGLGVGGRTPTTTMNNTVNSITGLPITYRQIKGRRKRRQRRQIVYKLCRRSVSGLGAALISVTLSYLFLPLEWFQIDYHHQLQHEAQYLYQQLERQRKPYHHPKSNHIWSSGDTKYSHDLVVVGPRENPKQPKNLRRPGTLLEGGAAVFSEDGEWEQVLGGENPSTPGHHHVFERMTCSDGVTLGYKNDEYCDCLDDGRDEPATSACSHVLVAQPHIFYCGRHLSSNTVNNNDSSNTVNNNDSSNNNHDNTAAKDNTATTTDTRHWIYTSRVNDGIVDCPDGSDEYDNRIATKHQQQHQQ